MQPQIKSPDLSHLKGLTTEIGLIQHCKLGIPDLSFGYSIDDCARALIAIYQYLEIYQDQSVLPLAKIYLNYIKKAKIKGGYFHNFADQNGIFIDQIGSETSTARTIWALGYIVNREDISKQNASVAREMLLDLPPIENLKYIRSKAYALIGFCFLKDYEKVKKMADAISESYEENKATNWFENNLSYANAILPYSLFLAFDLLKDGRCLKIATESLLFLDKTMRIDSIPSPIGHTGWDFGSNDKPVYDQQVIEATDMILAATAGSLASSEIRDGQIVRDWFGWFTGFNINKVSLLDETNGACFDSLTKEGRNLNQGAESMVCYLLAHLAISDSGVVAPLK
ncbi:MAG: hypothetical protein NTW50_03330 [Candidatus Berkelbacteria bacterium]|nr:hypothetical protein [Candidatus Berkelbacteria bacterium]